MDSPPPASLLALPLPAHYSTSSVAPLPRTPLAHRGFWEHMPSIQTLGRGPSCHREPDPMEKGAGVWLGKPHTGPSDPEINWFCLCELPSKQLGLSRNAAQRGFSPERTDRLPPGWAPWVDTVPLNGVTHDDGRVNGRGKLVPCLSVPYIKGVKTLRRRHKRALALTLRLCRGQTGPLVPHSLLCCLCV